jgi:hypothetical protein
MCSASILIWPQSVAALNPSSIPTSSVVGLFDEFDQIER